MFLVPKWSDFFKATNSYLRLISEMRLVTVVLQYQSYTRMGILKLSIENQ